MKGGLNNPPNVRNPGEGEPPPTGFNEGGVE